MFFDKEYVFKGKHAKYVTALKSAVFNRNVDVLLLAPIVGLVYNRKATIDNSGEVDEKPTSIFVETMISEKERIMFNYQLCMLLCDENHDEQKVNNAFKYCTEDYLEQFERNIKIYNSYILGGVEVLYEMLLNGNKEYNGNPNNEEYKMNIIEHITEFIGEYIEEAHELNNISDEIEIL